MEILPVYAGAYLLLINHIYNLLLPISIDNMPVLGNSECKLCERHHNAPIVNIQGQGPVPCDVMLVGEAPTIYRGDLTKPFSGNSGRLLDRILMDLDVGRDSLYLTQVMHCLHGATQLHTEEGLKFIRDVVKQKWPGKVLSVGPTGLLEWKKITNWYQTRRDGRALYKITFIGGKKNGRGDVGCITTPEHKFLTPQGYVCAKDLTEKSLIATGYPTPGPRTLQVLIGSLLGDGCVSSGKYTESHCIAQKLYIEQKIRLFTPFLEKNKAGKEISGICNKGKYHKIHYGLDTSYYFHDLSKSWYNPEGKKTIPKDLHKYLDWLGIAIWYMDDGNYSQKTKHARIALGNLSEEDATYLKSILENRGLELTLSHRTIWRISISRASTKIFLSKVAKYITPDMRYKLNEESQKTPYDPTTYEPELPVTSWRNIEVKPWGGELKNSPKGDQWRNPNWVYCVDVEDNHNFRTAGGIVHNCAAPENASPSQSEIKACKVNLQKEIDEVKPKFIILLGAVALKGVLGKGESGIMQIHGNPIEKEGITYLPTFHPAASLRDPKKEAPLRADFKKFFEIIKGTWKPSTGLNLEVVKTQKHFEEMIKDLKTCPVIGFDLETSGLDQFEPEGTINCLGISRYKDKELTEEKQYILPMSTMGEDCPFPLVEDMTVALNRIKEAMQGKKVVTQNGKFDNLWLRSKWNIRYPITYDTMMAAHLLDENSPCGLKYLAKVHLNAPAYDLTSDQKRGEVDPELLYKYCGYDVLYTLRLYKMQREQLLKQIELLRLFKFLIMPSFEAFEDIEFHGVYVHQERLAALEIELTAKLEKVATRLEELSPGTNWASPKQVGKILFEKWGLHPLEMTKSGAPSTAEGILQRLKGQHEGIDLLLSHRGLSKQISSFVVGWKRFIDSNGRMHPSFKLHGTTTGRISCSDPNLQQVPREKSIRTLIGAPKGWRFLECDYSQVELRIAAMASNDKTMLEIFNNASMDIHRKTAQVLTGKEEVSKEERKRAKAVNFGFLYSMGARKFQEYARDKYATDLTLEEATLFRNRFFETYPGLPKWHQRQKIMVRQYGQVRNPLGRIRHLPEILSPDEGVRAQAERNAINAPVQGFASDITQMAVVAVHQAYGRDMLNIVGSIHDAILMEIREDVADQLLPEIKKLIEHPPLLDKLGAEMTVPLVADAHFGDWGSE